MSWLSTSFGFILLIFFLTIWAAPSPQWGEITKIVAENMNFTDVNIIYIASEEAGSVDKAINDFFRKASISSSKVTSRSVVKNAYKETVVCIQEFFREEQKELFMDCIHHAIDVSLARLRALKEIQDRQTASGASRLKIWH
ncbi:uncharacterized protein LOC108117192 [Drosophila eugracilis]|uniref:uncharacterized protein LOC108117192 n=1 Tax=Drosophila eugracilis TaxID=29029 RepID=UPI001BDB0991|nr:uncharacterized protein LOC108117192 [Drosophila eugracilis]